MIVVLLLALLPAAAAFDDELFKHHMLQEYNFYRSVHQVSEVRLSPRLSARSALWAEYLGIVSDNACLRHSKVGGENLYFYWGTSTISEQTLAKKCVQAFYREIKYYNYNRPGLYMPAAHFTEMIWKAVKEIGIAVYKRPYTNRHGGCNVRGSPRRPAVGYFVVIQHEPHGNLMNGNQFMLNVLPPTRTFAFL